LGKSDKTGRDNPHTKMFPVLAHASIRSKEEGEGRERTRPRRGSDHCFNERLTLVTHDTYYGGTQDKSGEQRKITTQDLRVAWGPEWLGAIRRHKMELSWECIIGKRGNAMPSARRYVNVCGCLACTGVKGDRCRKRWR